MLLYFDVVEILPYVIGLISFMTISGPIKLLVSPLVSNQLPWKEMLISTHFPQYTSEYRHHSTPLPANKTNDEIIGVLEA
jgi:hypothetical protein